MGAGCSDQPSLNKVFDLNSSSMRKVDDRMTEKQEGMGGKPYKIEESKNVLASSIHSFSLDL